MACSSHRKILCSDLKALCHEAALGPLRGLGHEIANIHADEVRPIDIADFEEAISVVRPSLVVRNVIESGRKNLGPPVEKIQICHLYRLLSNTIYHHWHQ